MKREQSIVKNPLIRDEIFMRDKGICGICGQPVNPKKFHLDHIIPWSRGGEDNKENLQIAHPHCNISKGNSTVNKLRSGGGKRKYFVEEKVKSSICFFIDKECIDKLDQLAKKQRRTKSQQLAKIIDENYEKLPLLKG